MDEIKIEDGEDIPLGTPPEIIDVAAAATNNLLPAKSEEQYKRQYKIFIDWRVQNKTDSFSENVLLAYFQHLSTRMKPSSLWSIYSMLRMTINFKNNIDISKYPKLCAFLKRTSDGYKPKKSKTLTPEQINEFLLSASDEIHLFTKVGLIFGVVGACRREELLNIEVSHVEDLSDALLVHIPDIKNNRERQFVIVGNFYNICKKYMKLRPPNLVNVSRFFLNYQRGKCTKQPVGINKFGSLANQVATFLKLPDAASYTGHCMRRSSATILDSGADNKTLKRHREWRSTSVADNYINHSLNNKIQAANKILNTVEDSENNGVDNSEITPAPEQFQGRIKLEYYEMEDEDVPDFLPISKSEEKETKPNQHSQCESTNSLDHPPPKKPAVPTQANIDVGNEFELFGQSIAVQLKKMPLDRALLCQEKIQQMMTQERLTLMQTWTKGTNEDVDPLAL